MTGIDEAKGRAKRAGELTGNDDLKQKGAIDKATGKAKDGADRVADKAKNVLDKDN